MSKVNKVVKFNVSGGLIGMFAGDEASKLDKILRAENTLGWRYRSHGSNTFNLISLLINLLLLVITFTLWSPGSRYLLVLDRMD